MKLTCSVLLRKLPNGTRLKGMVISSRNVRLNIRSVYGTHFRERETAGYGTGNAPRSSLTLMPYGGVLHRSPNSKKLPQRAAISIIVLIMVISRGEKWSTFWSEPECINLGFPNCLSQRCCLSNDLHIPPCISQPQPLYSKISISSLERTLQRKTGELNNNLELHKKHQTQEF